MSIINVTKVATPSAPAATRLRFFYSSSLTPAAPAFVDESGNICRIGGLTTKDYRLVKVVYIFQGTTSYTPTSGVTALLVECWGAGAAGGGTNANAGSVIGAGGGGGGGAYSAVWSTTNVSGAHTVAVGAGGTGVSGATGNAGGDTDFKDTAGTSICTAKGGSGGIGDTCATGPRIGAAGGAGGAASSGVGDVKQDGQVGGYGVCLTTTAWFSGDGAGGVQGMGGGLRLSGTGAGGGTAGSVYASGGSGAGSSSTTAQTGGDGKNGLMCIREYA